MEKNLYIDASHPDETRVVLKSNGNIEDYEYEGIKNTLIQSIRKKSKRLPGSRWVQKWVEWMILKNS